MNDDELRNALRSMEVSPASPTFTAQTMARLARRRHRRQRALWAVCTVTAFAGMIAVVGWMQARTHNEAATARRVDEMRVEYNRLKAELETLKQQHKAAAPVLYLGGDENVDVVLDLRRLKNSQRSTSGTWQ